MKRSCRQGLADLCGRLCQRLVDCDSEGVETFPGGPWYEMVVVQKKPVRTGGRGGGGFKPSCMSPSIHPPWGHARLFQRGKSASVGEEQDGRGPDRDGLTGSQSSQGGQVLRLSARAGGMSWWLLTKSPKMRWTPSMQWMDGLDTYRPWMAGHHSLTLTLTLTAGNGSGSQGLGGTHPTGAPATPVELALYYASSILSPITDCLRQLPRGSQHHHRTSVFLARNWPALESGSGLGPRMLEGKRLVLR